jgi:hypothetical protein
MYKDLFLPIISIFLIITSAIAQEIKHFDVRDDWTGYYQGSCKVYDSDVISFSISIGKDKTLRAEWLKIGDLIGSKDLRVNIWLPEDQQTVKNFYMDAEKISIEPSATYPYKISIKKTKSSFGDDILSGSITFYRLLPDGTASIEYEIGQFSIVIKNKF